MARRIALGAAVWLCCAATAQAQESGELREILQRIERLEQQNQQLMEEVRALRNELAASRAHGPAPEASVSPPAPSFEDRVAVNESRIAELAQTKVEASQRFPIRLTGMALFNSFWDSNAGGGNGYTTVAVPDAGHSAGATLRQTVLGLEYRGPQIVWHGKVHGSLFMDFFGSSGRSTDSLVRLRTASIGVDWKERSVEVGLERPLISPRDPNSLADVAVPPLAGAGNLWKWIPQVRVEQRLNLGRGAQLRAQVAAVQTSELYGETYQTQPTGPQIEAKRPGVEGRLEFSAGEEHRVEIAPGFHRSVSHIGGGQVPSNIFSLDWYVRPWKAIEFTGAAFKGENVAHLGGAGQGFLVEANGAVSAVRSEGAWAQFTLKATSRLSFNLFSGAQNNRGYDVASGGIGRNLAYGANLFYRMAPNVLLSIESSQVRTNYSGAARQLGNRYDLALAYLF